MSSIDKNQVLNPMILSKLYFYFLKKLLQSFAVAMAIFFLICHQSANSQVKFIEPFTPPISEDIATKRADSILNVLSLDDKLQLIKGYNAFYIKGLEAFGIPELYLSDATQGVHIREKFLKFTLGEQLEKSTAFPCPIQLASTWNPDLAEIYAHAIGEECRAGGVGVLLGPGLNIYRVSQNGRNFEYMGEDPFLISRMVERYVIGMQSTGTITTLKHFVANNHEYRRKASNVILDDRAMREIYMPAFKAGIDAGAMAIMTSYNLVNGEWAGQSDKLINEILRKELGHQWLIMTDWNAVLDAKKVVTSGQDLEMPNGASMHNIKELLESGEIAESQIDRMVRSTLKTVIAMGLIDKPVKDERYLETFEQHKEVALNTAREGIVLLKNEKNILPIDPRFDKKILLTGKFIDVLAVGGGSAYVKGYDHITMKMALSSKYDNLKHIESPTDQQLKNADVVIVSVGTKDTEGKDRYFALPTEQELLVKKALELNENVIVIVNSGGGVRMTDWNDNVPAVVYNWYGGQMGNQALAEIIAGEVSPSGYLPISIEKEFADSPGANYIPSSIDLSKKQQIRKMEEAAKNIYDIEYKEGILVGYRWYDTKKIEPLYPFGHGLTYTNFLYSDIKLSEKNISPSDILTVSFRVKNIGNVVGATVAQVYVKDVKSSLIRPEKELKGFKKIKLNPGESQTVSIQLDANAFSFWNEKTRKWEAENGTFDILLGKSSRNIVAKRRIRLKN